MPKTRYDIAPYAPVDDIHIPSYRDDTPSQPTGDTSGWSLIVVSANVLLALILIVGMLWDGRSVIVSIVTGGLYYAVTTLGVIALSSGQAGAMWRIWQQERTERYRIDAYEYLAERKLELEQPRVESPLPAVPMQTPSGAPGSSFVPAYPPGVAEEALAWVRGLYGRDGSLDRRRVRSGYVQGSVIGSKRAGGSSEAKQLLIDLKVLKPVAGGYMFNVRRYPTLGHVDQLAARLRDVVGGWPGGDTQG